MDQAKFKAMDEAVRIGGKGTVRRKHKRVPPSGPIEMRRLQATLTKLSFVQMQGIEELTFSMADKSQIVIKTPKIEGSAESNTLVITGKETRTLFANPVKPSGRNKTPSKMSPPPPPKVSPPPLQALTTEKQAKKKKPRQRVRARNKHFKEQLLLMAASNGGSIDGAMGEGPDDKNLLNAGFVDYGGGDDSGDSEKTTVPSEGSDMDRTIMGSQKDISDGSDFDSVSWEAEKTAENEEKDDEENPQTDANDIDNEGNENKDGDDGDDESISIEMTLNDIMNSLDEFYTY